MWRADHSSRGVLPAVCVCLIVCACGMCVCCVCVSVCGVEWGPSGSISPQNKWIYFEQNNSTVSGGITVTRLIQSTRIKSFRNAIPPTKNIVWIDLGSNPCLRGENPATSLPAPCVLKNRATNVCGEVRVYAFLPWHTVQESGPIDAGDVVSSNGLLVSN